jgi:hypothetical protein
MLLSWLLRARHQLGKGQLRSPRKDLVCGHIALSMSLDYLTDCSLWEECTHPLTRHDQRLPLPKPDDGAVAPAEESIKTRKQLRRRVTRIEGTMVLEEQTLEFVERTVVWNVSEAVD